MTLVGVYLVKLIHLRAPYMIFGFWWFLGVLFWGNFGVLEIFENGFVMRMHEFGGDLFREIDSVMCTLLGFSKN